MPERMTQEEFIESAGKQCPKCRTRSFIGFLTDVRRLCQGCGARWTIHYGPQPITGYRLPSADGLYHGLEDDDDQL